MPPPSSGGVVLVHMLNILEGFDLREIGHNSALYLHLLTESMRRAYADRANFLGDPDFNEDLPIPTLTSKEHAAAQRATIDMDHKSASNPARFAQLYESKETTHFSVVDKDGNMVSMTYTLERGFGSPRMFMPPLCCPSSVYLQQASFFQGLFSAGMARTVADKPGLYGFL